MKIRHIIIGVIILLAIVGLVMLDSDGIGAREELNNGTNPFQSDTDMDGLNDPQEYEYNTSPINNDTDGDRLDDGAEVNKYNTNPNNPDTDNDGLTDGQEVNEFNTSPTNADTDDDGLNDSREIELGTNPNNPDTDGDGLKDGVEVNEYNTSPTNADTDDDGLNDSREIKLGTDPTDADTDNDGLTDYTEIENDSYPNSDPLQKDIYIEVDVDASNTNEINKSLNIVAEEFNNAPVENPDGTTGINVHYVKESILITNNEVNVDVYKNELYTDEFTDGYGYHHLVITDKQVCHQDVSCDRIAGFAVFSNGGINGGVVDSDQEGSKDIANTVLHEMGHLLGITSDTYRGVDSKEVPFDQYPSVMNYNSPSDYTKFSNGEGYDDWNTLNRTLDTVNTTKLYNNSTQR